MDKNQNQNNSEDLFSSDGDSPLPQLTIPPCDIQQHEQQQQQQQHSLTQQQSDGTDVYHGYDLSIVEEIDESLLEAVSTVAETVVEMPSVSVEPLELAQSVEPAILLPDFDSGDVQAVFDCLGMPTEILGHPYEVDKQSMYRCVFENVAARCQAVKLSPTDTYFGSEEFELLDQTWRFQVYPTTGSLGPQKLGVFLELVKPQVEEGKRFTGLCVHFVLAARPWYAAPPGTVADDGQTPIEYIPGEWEHNHTAFRYMPTRRDWGFHKFSTMDKLLCNPFTESTMKPYKVLELLPQDLPNALYEVRVFLRTLKDIGGCVMFHDYGKPRIDVGYVGLENQGTTCYMNSMLQSLFFTNVLRKTIYQIPIAEEELIRTVKLMPHALQRLFYQMETSSRAVNTQELTRSFGWDHGDVFIQHDVQEFSRKLIDSIEEKMKGTSVEGFIEKLFVGKMKSYIKCINVDYESSRTENFYDIQLIVKGCLTLGDSFRAYTEVEVMDEDNQYRSDDYGLQDAHKGVLFEHFPPVLHLQLKRFEYDFERDRMVKNNDRFEFPEEIDLTEFLTADSAQINANNNYVLHGVLVHAGSLQSGHYYAMIKPEKNGRWIKFNDDHVRPVPANIAIDDNYGGMEYNVEKTNSKGNKVRAHANAYMLVYIREEALDEVLAPVTIDDIPQHLQNAMAEQEAKLKAQLEQQERDRLRREESKRNMTIRVITMNNFKLHGGFDLSYLDTRQAASNKLLAVRFPKTGSPSQLKEYLIRRFYSLEQQTLVIPEEYKVQYSHEIQPIPYIELDGDSKDDSKDDSNEGKDSSDSKDIKPKFNEFDPSLITSRLWSIHRRDNNTFRPSLDLSSKSKCNSRLDVIAREEAWKTGELPVYFEQLSDIVGYDNEFGDSLPSVVTMGDSQNEDQIDADVNKENRIMLFVKLYNPDAHSMNGLCVIYPKMNELIVSQFSKLAKVANIPYEIKDNNDDAEYPDICAFEEIAPALVNSILDPFDDFYTREISSGDIIVIQASNDYTNKLLEREFAKMNNKKPPPALFPSIHDVLPSYPLPSSVLSATKAPGYLWKGSATWLLIQLRVRVPIVFCPIMSRDHDDISELYRKLMSTAKSLNEELQLSEEVHAREYNDLPLLEDNSQVVVDFDNVYSAADLSSLSQHGAFHLMVDSRTPIDVLTRMVAHRLGCSSDKLILTPDILCSKDFRGQLSNNNLKRDSVLGSIYFSRFKDALETSGQTAPTENRVIHLTEEYIPRDYNYYDCQMIPGSTTVNGEVSVGETLQSSITWYYEISHSVDWKQLDEGIFIGITLLKSDVKDALSVNVYVTDNTTVKDIIESVLDRQIVRMWSEQARLENVKRQRRQQEGSTIVSPSESIPHTPSASANGVPLANLPSDGLGPAPNGNGSAIMSPSPTPGGLVTDPSRPLPPWQRPAWIDEDGNALTTERLIAEHRVRLYGVYPNGTTHDYDYETAFVDIDYIARRQLVMEIIPHDQYNAKYNVMNSSQNKKLTVELLEDETDDSSIIEIDDGSECGINRKRKLENDINNNNNNGAEDVSKTRRTFATQAADVTASRSHNGSTSAETAQQQSPRIVTVVGFDHSSAIIDEGSKWHGIPFRILIQPSETLAELAPRLKHRLGMGDKEFSRVKVKLARRSELDSSLATQAEIQMRLSYAQKQQQLYQSQWQKQQYGKKSTLLEDAAELPYAADMALVDSSDVVLDKMAASEMCARYIYVDFPSRHQRVQRGDNSMKIN